MTTKTNAAASEKSAADLLIEMQLEEKRKKSINPMAVTETSKPKDEKNLAGVAIVERVTFANGAVVEQYA